MSVNERLVSPTLQKPLFINPEVFGTGSTVVVHSSTKMGVLSSLRRLKEDIRDVNVGEGSEVLELQPRRFIVDGEVRYGFIAEEIHAVDFNLSEMMAGELSGYDTRGILALLVKLVQEQQKQIARLKEAIEAE